MNNFDNELNKLKEPPVAFTRLDEEIEKEEEKRRLDNIETFKKSQKPKKKLRNKIIAWVLGSAIFAGAAAGAGLLIYDKTNGDGAYNDAIQTRFEQVDEKLTEKLIQTIDYDIYQNKEITHIRFIEPEEKQAELQVFYKGDFETHLGMVERTGFATFNVLLDYYEALVDAEIEGNVLYYLDALETIFENMNLVNNETKNPITCEIKNNTEENVQKFNEIFNIDEINNDDIVRQVGFLPYHVQIVNYTYNSETFKHEYTYKISGISYCETKSENSDEIKQHEDLILEREYNKNHIKTYQRDVLFSTSRTYDGEINLNTCLSWDISFIMDGEDVAYNVETTHFKEIDLLKLYEDVKDGDFDYKKPKDFNVKEYVKNMEEMENAK